jgi:hypothetical protein
MFKEIKGTDLIKKMGLSRELIWTQIEDSKVLFKCYLFRLAVIKP